MPGRSQASSRRWARACRRRGSAWTSWLFEAAWKRRWGTTSEQTLVRQTHVATLPDGADHDLGAALGIPFIAAHR